MSTVKKTITLRRQFIQKMVVILLVVALVSGAIQFYFLLQQINENVTDQANLVSQGIQQGIKETDLASRSIEQQIDYKLELISERIGDRLNGRAIENITNEDLIQLKDEFKIDGITLFSRKGDDIVGTKATDEKEIGFSFKENFGLEDSGYLGLNDLLNNKKPVQSDVSYVDQNIITLYTSQSGSHGDVPEFFKYAYYHDPSQNFVINPYIKANEVYQFTKSVGPDQWIKSVIEENKYVEEVAVLDPRVYEDPSLAEKMYPPLQKIVNGGFQYHDQKDENTLISLAKNPKSISYISTVNGEKVYKVFIPTDKGQVIYIALNYSKMSLPLYEHSLILIISGFISLVTMFVLTANFFSTIYKNIQRIIVQIKSLEVGDFTVKSSVADKGELSNLSESVNHMMDILNKVLSDTTDQASKVQYLATTLKTDANQSVDKMYVLSMDVTSKAREDVEEVLDFLETLETHLHSYPRTDEVSRLLSRIETIRSIAGNRATSVTDITITLSDLLKSLQSQSAGLSEISSTLFKDMEKFKL